MNSKWSYLVSNQYLPSSIAKNAIVYQLFQNLLFLQGRICQQETPPKNVNHRSLQPIIQTIVYLCTAPNPTVSQRTRSANQVSLCPSCLPCPSKLFLPEIVSQTNLVVSVDHSDQTLKRRWPFDLRSFVICPFRAQLLGGSLPYSLADILRYCLSKLLFINWLKEEITTAKNKLLKRSTVCSCHMFAVSTVDMCYIDTFLLNQNPTHEIPSL